MFSAMACLSCFLVFSLGLPVCISIRCLFLLSSFYTLVRLCVASRPFHCTLYFRREASHFSQLYHTRKLIVLPDWVKRSARVPCFNWSCRHELTSEWYNSFGESLFQKYGTYLFYFLIIFAPYVAFGIGLLALLYSNNTNQQTHILNIIHIILPSLPWVVHRENLFV